MLGKAGRKKLNSLKILPEEAGLEKASSTQYLGRSWLEKALFTEIVKRDWYIKKLV